MRCSRQAILLIVGLLLFFTHQVKAFWPFEKAWSYNPAQHVLAIDDNGYEYSLLTEAKTIGEALAEQKIALGKDDSVFPEKDAQLSSGMRVIIRRALPVTIKVDGEEMNVMSFAMTVEEAIRREGITLSRLDKVKPSKEDPLEENMVVTITRINVEEVTEEETIEFSIVEKDDPKLKWKKQRIEQEGENGTKDVKYRITYTNGKQSSKVKLSSVVTKEPVQKIIYNGTKIEVGKITKGRASWYAYTGTMACASLQFPKGTWLRVTNRANGKQIIVQVNDSGPYSEDKIIDLDKVAFQKIADLGQGVTEVKVEEILE